jgi:uncharacterized repeat protein (TIGR03803 family)
MPHARMRFLSITTSLIFVVASILTRPLFAADTEKVLKYLGAPDGYGPQGGLIFDDAGNLYGTTLGGGLAGCGYGNTCGTVFELSPRSDGTWKRTVIHQFTDQEAGAPVASLVFDSAGNLYGTASGCTVDGCNGGAVFELERQPGRLWKCKILYRPAQPIGPLIFDRAGDLYGTDFSGGDHGFGSVFKLTLRANGKWAAKILYSFTYGTNGANGNYPVGGLIFDVSGNLYGTTCCGGIRDGACEIGDDFGCGIVFELTPEAGGQWKESVLHRFNEKDGAGPATGLISDGGGNLYGVTQWGGSCDAYSYGCGVVFQLVPQGNQWAEKIIHNFDGVGGSAPQAGLTIDSSSNLYGTTFIGGGPCFDYRGCGVAFELLPAQDGKWTYEVLFKFRGEDGAYPSSDLISDTSGNLYGETSDDEGNTAGTAFELTP